MFLSATQIGKLFGLNGQEMNMALKNLDYLDGEPGDYILTEKGLIFGRESDFHRGTGGSSWYNRYWTQRSYDESIIEQLREEMTPEVIRAAVEQVKEHRAAQIAARAAEQAAYEEELLRKQQEEAAAMAEALRHQHNIRTGVAIAGGVVTVVLIAGITWFCIHRSRKKKREAEREQLEKDRAMEMAMNAYYYNTNVDESDAQPDNLTQ